MRKKECSRLFSVDRFCWGSATLAPGWNEAAPLALHALARSEAQPRWKELHGLKKQRL